MKMFPQQKNVHKRLFFFQKQRLNFFNKRRNSLNAFLLHPSSSSSSSSCCSWLARTDPRDVARVESKTVIVTPDQRDTVPSPVDGGVSQLGRWMSPEEFDKAMTQRFPGCMKGTTEMDVSASKSFPSAVEKYTTSVKPH